MCNKEIEYFFTIKNNTYLSLLFERDRLYFLSRFGVLDLFLLLDLFFFFDLCLSINII